MQPDASGAFYRSLMALQLALLAAARRAWAQMDPDEDFDRSWNALLPSLLTVVAAGQLAAARLASAYVPAVLTELGTPIAPESIVVPAAFSGVAADGRSLAGLLVGAVVRAKEATRAQVVETSEYLDDGEYNPIRYTVPGKPPEQALAEGGRWLDTLVRTVTNDAARGATQAEIAVRPGVGYVRMVNPPCCGRCAILAGRWYRWNAGFPRHPHCDCISIPAPENIAGSLLTNPQALLDRGLVRGLTKREQTRLDAGDDLYKVINESRDMWRARITEQRAAAEIADQAQRDQTARQGLEDLFASTRSRVEALTAMRDQGYIR